MGCLTTHILDTANGCPAANVRIELYGRNDEKILLIESVTNADGRLDNPLLEGESFSSGRYEMVFYMGQYFADKGLQLDAPPFVDEVVLRFGIAHADQHYHVPLLVSPWSYSTYRGS